MDTSKVPGSIFVSAWENCENSRNSQGYSMMPALCSASDTCSMSTLMGTSFSSMVVVTGSSPSGTYSSMVTMAFFGSLLRASTSDANNQATQASTTLTLMTNSA